MKKITYLTEISKTYTEGLRNCGSQEELRKFLEGWKEFASDAIQVVESKDFSWQKYLKGERLERQGKYSGDEWNKKYGAILLPKVILLIGLKAAQLKAPEGTVFIRLKELGYLKKQRGIYEMIDDTNNRGGRKC